MSQLGSAKQADCACDKRQIVGHDSFSKQRLRDARAKQVGNRNLFGCRRRLHVTVRKARSSIR
jgi:hypothetical protein